MYSRNSFGDFYPINSSIHKINSLLKIICFILFLIIIMGSNTLKIHIFMATFILAIMIMSNVPLRFYLNTIYSLRYIFLILLFVFAHLGFTLELCVVFFMKILIVLEYLDIIIYTTSSSEMYYAIENVLKPFNIFNFNLGKIAMGITNAIRYIPMLITTEYKIIKTQASRGIDYYNCDILGKIYVYFKTSINAVRLSKVYMKKNMEFCKLRMFNVRKRRSNLRTNNVGFNDFLMLSFHVAILIAYLFDKGLIK